MRTFIVLLTTLLSLGLACAEVPESRRSLAAIERVKSALERDLSAKELEYGAQIFIQITKIPARLSVHIEGDDGRYRLFRTYPICTYSGGLGPKMREGDRKSPEGFYRVRPAQMNPASSFHLSFNLGYPNAYDRSKGYTGSYLMVHGDCVSVGCYAMTDPAIDEIWTLMTAAFEHGQREIQVHIFPFEMNWPMNTAIPGHPDQEFWAELIPAWKLFAAQRIPPQISVADGQYIVEPAEK